MLTSAFTVGVPRPTASLNHADCLSALSAVDADCLMAPSTHVGAIVVIVNRISSNRLLADFQSTACRLHAFLRRLLVGVRGAMLSIALAAC